MARKSLTERFWEKVDIRGEDECWPWTACTNHAYGWFRLSGSSTNAHRVAYELSTGQEIPIGQVVRHKCDNPPCCNPGHIILGTQADNIRDRMKRGRCRPAKGEINGQAKLIDQNVREIRASKLSNAYLSRKYGINASGISRIRSGKQWVHVK